MRHLNWTRQCCNLFSTLQSAQLERDIYKAAVESSAIGTILLDEQGNVLRVDAAAERILARNSALSMHRGRLTTKNRALDAQLQEAVALNLSEQTTRTYSKQIFRKTGTHRQAELVRLILTSVAHLASDEAPR